MHEVVRFYLVGGLNTCVGLTVIFTCKLGFGMPDVPANMIGYAIGLVVSFLLNARITFRYRGMLRHAAGRFALSFAVSYLANLAVVLLLIEVTQANSYIAQLAGVLTYSVLFYVASRTFVFKRA